MLPPPGTWQNVSAEDLRDLLRQPVDLVLVDVRSPEEFADGHIPGARLIPLPEFESALDDLDADRLHVFYCHSGVRSLYAARLAAEARSLPALNLQGGILAWRGEMLDGMPAIHVFQGAESVHDAILRAAELEQATQRMYLALFARFRDTPAGATFETLARAESVHASHLTALLPASVEPIATDARSPIESGGVLADVLQRIDSAPMLSRATALELALAVEYSALDMYENLAARASTDALRSAFEDLARNERRHAAAVIDAFRGLPG